MLSVHRRSEVQRVKRAGTCCSGGSCPRTNRHAISITIERVIAPRDSVPDHSRTCARYSSSDRYSDRDGVSPIARDFTQLDPFPRESQPPVRDVTLHRRALADRLLSPPPPIPARPTPCGFESRSRRCAVRNESGSKPASESYLDGSFRAPSGFEARQTRDYR